MTTDRPSLDGEFRGSGLWAVILGGSSGFGLAAAQRLARAGLNIFIGHKDPAGVVDSVLEPEFDRIRAQNVQLATHNGNLFDDEERGAVLESIESLTQGGKVRLFMQSIAAGSCKLIAEPAPDPSREKALDGLRRALEEEQVRVEPAVLERAVDKAFHEKGCDALYPVAQTRIPYRGELLREEELARTLYMMGSDYMLWGRELLRRGLLSKGARLMAMTSEGSASAWKGYAAVSAAKCVLEALCRSMAVEMAPHGVRCFLVQAGLTDTPAGNAIPGFDLMKARARLRNPLRRLTRPEDVAEAVHAMCLPGFDWLNGTVVRVDGGEAISGA